MDFLFCFSHFILWVRVVVFNITFNNISGISWLSVLLTLTAYIKLKQNLVMVLGMDCTGSCKSKCHKITTMAPHILLSCLKMWFQIFLKSFFFVDLLIWFMKLLFADLCF
jgi:hypothetical protein